MHVKLNNTPCKLCIFAEWDGVRQTGCSTGKLDKFRQRGASILECYDDTNEFYVIENNICPSFRTSLWEKNIKGDVSDTIEKENEPRFHCIVFVDDSIDDVKKTFDSICKQKLQPKNLTFILKVNSKILPTKIRDILKDSNTKIEWRIQGLQVEIEKEAVIHMVCKAVKNIHYYAVCNAGYEYNDDVLLNIKKYTLDELMWFAMIKENEDSLDGMIIPVSIHNHFYYNVTNKVPISVSIENHQCKSKQKIVYKMSEIKALLES